MGTFRYGAKHLLNITKPVAWSLLYFTGQNNYHLFSITLTFNIDDIKYIFENFSPKYRNGR